MFQTIWGSARTRLQASHNRDAIESSLLPKTCSNECSNGLEFPRIRANGPEQESPASWTNAVKCERRRTGQGDMTRKGSQVRVLYGPPLLSWENSPLSGGEPVVSGRGAPAVWPRFRALTPGRSGFTNAGATGAGSPVPQSLRAARTRIEGSGRSSRGRPLPTSFGLQCGELCTCHAS